MDFMPLFGFGFFIMAIVSFFQNVHKETLQEEIKELKNALLEQRRKNELLVKMNVELFSEIHQDSFFDNHKEFDQVIENYTKS